MKPVWLHEDGGYRSGRSVSRSKGKTEMYECFICNKRQAETKITRARVSRVRCRHCGNIVYPCREFSGKVPPKPKCKKCKCSLPVGNSIKYCSSCFNGMSYFHRQRAMGME